MPSSAERSTKQNGGRREALCGLFGRVLRPECTARIRAAVAELEAAGIPCTASWLSVIASVGDPNPRNAMIVDRRHWATKCLSEIDDANCVWFVVPSPHTTRGAWLEAGYAYNSGKHLVFSGDTAQSIFCSLGWEFGTDAAAVEHIKQLAHGHAIVQSAKRGVDASFDLGDIDEGTP